jgi:hypothetical protein
MIMTKEEILQLRKDKIKCYTQLIKRHQKDTYNAIVDYCNKYNIKYSIFSQAVYHYVYEFHNPNTITV